MFEELKNECLKCNKCKLSRTRNNVVFGSGLKEADILIIGEAPGKNEDQEGRPFVGKAGQDLTKYLEIAGLGRNEIFIANILKCRPPNNRDPDIEEIRACAPWLIKQIEIIDPKIICTLGNYSTKFILAKCIIENMQSIAGITGLHGTLQNVTFNNKTYKVFPMFHPAALIYNRQLTSKMEEDMKKLKDILNDGRQPDLTRFF